MIRIVCISRINLLSGRTNVYNLTKTCEALHTTQDFIVTLVTTDQDRGVDAFFKKNGVKHFFDVVPLGVTDTASKFGGKRWYEALMFFYTNIQLSWFILKNKKKFDVVYFRDDSLFLTAFFSKFILQKKVFFEVHSVLEGWYRQFRNRMSAKIADGIIAISGGLKSFYKKINNNILLSLCSAAEDLWFDKNKDKNSFRQELSLSTNLFLVGYTGVVGANPNNDYYEIDDVVKSLALLPENIAFVVVGEIHNNAQWLRDIANEHKVLNRLSIVPWQERSAIPKYLQAFDVVLIPKRKKDLVGDSPAKMFPALSSGRPIIAGQAECIEEVLTHEHDSFIVRENNPQGWAHAISCIYNNKEFSEKISNQAFYTSAQYTWEKRGASIGSFIKESFN